MKQRGEWGNTHWHCGCDWQSTISTILPKTISILLEKCWSDTIYWREGVNFQDSSEVRGGVCYLWQTIVRFLLKKVTTDLVNLESDKKKKKLTARQVFESSPAGHSVVLTGWKRWDSVHVRQEGLDVLLPAPLTFDFQLSCYFTSAHLKEHSPSSFVWKEFYK